MVTLNAAPRIVDRVTQCQDGHALKVLHIPSGGYHVTCIDCDWWTTIPAGERLKGWDDRGLGVQRVVSRANATNRRSNQEV